MLTRSTLPGKLADCTSTDRADSEIFLVEGDSAGAPEMLPSNHTAGPVLCGMLCLCWLVATDPWCI